MKYRIIIYILLSVYFTPVQANTFYFGLSGGSSIQSGEFSIINSSPNSSVGINSIADYQTPEDKSKFYSAFFGYKLGRDLVLEVGYAQNELLESPLRPFGDAGNAVFETAETNYYYAAFVGIWPISKSWAFTTRVGVSVWDMIYMQTKVDPLLSETDSGYIVNTQMLTDNTSALLVGVGLSYGISRHVEIKINVENHFVDFSFTNLKLDYEAASASMGLVFHF